MNFLIAAALLAVVPNPPAVDDVLERWEWLDLKVDVTTARCGYENAWYQPSTGDIVLCAELFEKPGLGEWVLAHELGHAFMWQHDVPQRRGTKDQERVADELAFLMSTQDESYAAARWFNDLATRRPESDYDDDEHPAPLDRAAAILCLDAGKEGQNRLCAAMYASVLAHWVRILDGYLAE